MSLPTTPIAVISIPIISSANDITLANSGSPKPIGRTIIRPDIAILNTPIPTRGALNHLEIPRPPTPCIIPPIPLNNMANPPRNIANNIGGGGRSAKTKMEKTIAEAPSAILLRRDDVLRERENVPTAVFRIPTNSNTIERIRKAVKTARPGCARTYPDSIIEIVPMLICNTLNQVGVFTNCG